VLLRTSTIVIAFLPKSSVTLPLACSRSGLRRIGYSGSESEGQEGRQEVLSQVIKKIADVPRVIITDKLKSYNAARAELMPSVEHHQQKYQNNRAENSHQPTRLRERLIRRFKSAGHAQRFLSVFGVISSHFRVGRHLCKASTYRAVMKARFAVWTEAICVRRSQIDYLIVGKSNRVYSSARGQ
jgi:hypothetical protein